MKILASSLALICFSSCNYLMSQRIPNDVKIEQAKYVAVGVGSDASHLYKWPDDEYHTKLFDQWRNETKYMGTNSIVPYTDGKYKLYFSPSMYISFFGDSDSDYIMFVYYGDTIDGSGCFVRKVEPEDKALIREIINIAESSKKINTESLRFYNFRTIYWNK